MNHTTTLTILQYNVRKSKDEVMATLLRDPRILDYDILALQEPWRNPFISTTHNPISNSFHLCFPRDDKEAPARVCFFVNKKIDQASWRFIDHTRDLCTLELVKEGLQPDRTGEIAIHNTYNPDKNAKNRTSCLPSLKAALSAHESSDQIILGDFNLHHEYWGGEIAGRADAESDSLIDIIQEFQLESTLPTGTVTYDEKNHQSCIDLCYATPDIVNRIISSGIDNTMDHNSDHLPITTRLDITVRNQPPRTVRNWAILDEKKLRTTLEQGLPRVRRPKSKPALDRYTDEIITAIQTAISKSTPFLKYSPRTRAGWTRECKEVQAEARRLKRQNSREHTEESWEAYRAARNLKGRIIQKALRQAHRGQVEEAMKCPKNMWKLAKWAARRGEKAATTTPALKNPTTGVEYIKASEKAQLFRETFFPTPPEADLQDIDEAAQHNQVTFPDITEREVRQAIAATPPIKAPGPDGIINKVLHTIAHQITPHLTRVFNQSLRIGYCPLHLRQSTTAVIRKPDKDDYTAPKAYRPIALLNTVGKLMDAIIAKRISYATEAYQLLPSTHIGGRKGRSTDHAVHIITEKIYEAWNSPEETVASLLLLDVSGAFDNVSHARLLHNLRRRRIDERTVRWIGSFLAERSTNINFDGYKSESYPTATGIPQGSPLSPILYLYYNADLIETCNQQDNTIATGYIDDVAILSWGRSTVETCNGLGRTMELAEQWATKHASVFAPSKFQLTHFTRTRQKFNIECQVVIAEQAIIPSTKSKYLGMTLDSALNWKQHIRGIKIKATKSIGALASLAGATWGASLLDLRKIYQAVVVPQIMYGCSAWSIATEKRLGYTNQTLHCLNKLQARAAKIIAGAFRSTSGPALNVELYLLPIAQQIWKTNVEVVSRILSTPGIPSLVEFRSFRTRRTRRRRLKPYISPLEYIYRRLYQRRGPTIEEQEIINPYLAPPWWQGPHTSIAPSSEKAMREHNKELSSPQGNLHIYTDGSGINGHLGAAAVSPKFKHSRKAYMGDGNTSTVYVAELQGVKLALQIAEEDLERGNRRNKVIIYTDNQAAIRASGNPTGKSGAYVLTDIVHLISKLQGEQQLQVEIRWVPAHTGIPGNEMADIAAKEAAGWNKGEAWDQGTGTITAKTYPLQATLRTWIKQEAMAEWEYNWKTETRGRASYRYTQKPTSKVLKLHHGRRKWQSAILIQMRTEKIGLRDHLWQRKVPEYNDPTCGCREGKQTVAHVLTRCRQLQDIRRRELSGIGRLDLRAILNEHKLATKAIRFMEQTQILGQFRTVEQYV